MNKERQKIVHIVAVNHAVSVTDPVNGVQIAYYPGGPYGDEIGVDGIVMIEPEAERLIGLGVCVANIPANKDVIDQSRRRAYMAL